MAEVTLEQVRKVFPDDGFVAVDDFNLRVSDKEFVVLVGPSGCGKSTTLRMIAGLEEISGGTISIDGRVVNDVQPKDRDIAMVFQNYALYPHMTVFENMAFGLKLRHLKKSEIMERVQEAADILGLHDMLDRRPKALSGGQRQRVAVGRAIVRKPKVFLFDEPLSNLDAKMRVQMRVEINRLHHKLGATMIYVTHDQTEALTFADKVVVMYDGRVVQMGTPEELFERPAHSFVGYFIGSPGMNFFDAKIEGQRAFVQGVEVPLGAAYGPVSGRAQIGIRPEFCVLAREGGLPFQIQRIEDVGRHRIIRGTCGDVSVNVTLPEGMAIDAEATRLLFAPEKINVYADDWRVAGGAA